MKKAFFFVTILGVFLIYEFVLAYAPYVGYSGAPGLSGSCASTCHGSSGGTIQITGFPTDYVPGNSYIITISHAGGNSIRNFNGSCRIGTGSQNAGIITAGTNTSVYNVSSETNGIHLSSSSQSSGTFNWTAPAVGTGDVKLYVAGLQGSKNGPNTNLVLTSTEQVSGIHGNNGNMPKQINLFQNYPNPFNPTTNIKFDISKSGFTILKVYDLLGKEIQTLVHQDLKTGSYAVDFDASKLTSGVYFYRLEAGDYVETRKMVLMK